MVRTRFVNGLRILNALPGVKFLFANPFRLTADKSTFYHPQELFALQLKRKPIRIKPPETKYKTPGVFTVRAFPTAEEINLEALLPVLEDALSLKAEHIQQSLDVLRAVNESTLGCESQEIYVFREGVVVLWNVPSIAINNILAEVHKFEHHRYANHVVEQDSETIGYVYNYNQEDYVGMTEKQEVMLSPTNTQWEKYVTSHVLAANVKLTVWERQLEKYIRDVEFITEDLKYGRQIRMSEHRVLRKHGAIFALRHVINLSSALLEPPQMMNYTIRLDTMYKDLNTFYAMQKRLRFIKEKMNHCLELILLLSAYLKDKHRLRLEWLVIGLILIELCFETFYCVDRFFPIFK
ncbi:required for meiotic nuclear division protein 1 homolog [Onthophagus taurus]|uniref:required for meiotic nuclear division protein 1 homolog n=1 Tax=Onthophagus taurus TaxID=166361 RepID=UPI000C20A714|nr:required for meiotic nuclear division protein 1 homolog [Onthophagus taurus]